MDQQARRAEQQPNERVTLPVNFLGRPRFFSIFSSMRNSSSASSELLSSD
jgi:hypothetical protein